MSVLNVGTMNLSGRMNLPRLTQQEIDALDACLLYTSDAADE